MFSVSDARTILKERKLSLEELTLSEHFDFLRRLKKGFQKGLQLQVGVGVC